MSASSSAISSSMSSSSPHAASASVSPDKGLVGRGHRLGDQCEQPHHLVVDRVEVAVEPDAELAAARSLGRSRRIAQLRRRRP